MPDSARIYRIVLITGAFGGLLSDLVWGRSVGLGFSAGAALAAVNYWCLESLVQGIGTVDQGKTRGAPPGLIVARYLLLGLCGYVIVRVSGANVLALLVGCLTALTALIFETVYQLLYART